MKKQQHQTKHRKQFSVAEENSQHICGLQCVNYKSPLQHFKQNCENLSVCISIDV